MKLTKAHLVELNHIIDCVIDDDMIDKDLINHFIDIRFTLKQPSTKGQHMSEILKAKSGLRKLYEAISEAFIERKAVLIESEYYSNEAVMNQPKYKISDAAIILKIERATLNNWTNRKGGYIRSFQNKGKAKYILEEDLKNKYKEITGNDLVVDDTLRSKYEYSANV